MDKWIVRVSLLVFKEQIEQRLTEITVAFAGMTYFYKFKVAVENHSSPQFTQTS